MELGKTFPPFPLAQKINYLIKFLSIDGLAFNGVEANIDFSISSFFAVLSAKLLTNSLYTSFKLFFSRFAYIYNKNANAKYPQFPDFKSCMMKLLNNK